MYCRISCVYILLFFWHFKNMYVPHKESRAAEIPQHNTKCIYEHKHTHTRIYIYIHSCIYRYTNVYIYTYIHVYVYTYMCINMYMYMYIRVYIYNYICVYVIVVFHVYLYCHIVGIQKICAYPTRSHGLQNFHRALPKIVMRVTQ